MKKKMTITVKADPMKRNEMHFDVQRTTKAHVFIDRKKRAKNGYRKHKGQDD